eukprot:COSAG01_NODE_22000_length_876_cov_1.756757_2_plen_92_part_00
MLIAPPRAPSLLSSLAASRSALPAGRSPPRQSGPQLSFALRGRGAAGPTIVPRYSRVGRASARVALSFARAVAAAERGESYARWASQLLGF